jgi:hypothetical protein
MRRVRGGGRHGEGRARDETKTKHSCVAGVVARGAGVDNGGWCGRIAARGRAGRVPRWFVVLARVVVRGRTWLRLYVKLS